MCILMSYLLCRDNVPCAILLNKNKKIAICFLGVGFFFVNFDKPQFLYFTKFFTLFSLGLNVVSH